jgi:hypothetical protein
VWVSVLPFIDMYRSCAIQSLDHVGFSVIPAGIPFAARWALSTLIACWAGVGVGVGVAARDAVAAPTAPSAQMRAAPSAQISPTRLTSRFRIPASLAAGAE